MSASETDRQRFSAVFSELSPRVYGYARRQCDATTAHDVTAETFLVAWRRMQEMPEEPLPWLLGTARNVLRNHVRGTVRRDRLVGALTSSPVASWTGRAADADLLERTALAGALARLTDRERESLLLVAWDGLSTSQAAAVSGCSASTFARRLSRARARLTAALDDPSPPAPSAPRPTPRLAVPTTERTLR